MIYLNCENCGSPKVYFHEQPEGSDTYDCQTCGHMVFVDGSDSQSFCECEECN